MRLGQLVESQTEAILMSLMIQCDGGPLFKLEYLVLLGRETYYLQV